MNELQKMALVHALEAAKAARHIVICDGYKPDFGSAAQHGTKASEASQLLAKAEQWIEAVLKA